MRSLFQNEQPSPAQLSSTAGLSIVLHALLLVLIVAGSIHVRRVVIFRPTTRGSQIAVVAVSRSALASVLAQQHPVSTERAQPPRTNVSHRLSPALAKSTPTPAVAPVTQASQQQPSAGQGNLGIAGQGSSAQSMYPAYPIDSPSPQVRDRSLLPQTDQKVIVDVDLGADGKVQQATLVAGLGNALDQIVLDTIRGWQFHPAMLNGQPVSSRMELVFPFNRNYPQAE